MEPNPLADREKALENQWIQQKEKQMAKDRAAKTQAAKGAADQGQQSGNQEKK